MQELTDDQLDGLFRKSAEEFDVPFDPAAWEAMQGKLDDRDRASFWQRWLPWGVPALLLLLLTGGGWFAYQKGHPINAKAVSPVVATVGPTKNNPTKRTQPTFAATPTPATRRPASSDELAVVSPTREAPPVAVVKPGAARIDPENRLDKPTGRPAESEVTDVISATKRSVAAYRKKPERMQTGRSIEAVSLKRNRSVLYSGHTAIRQNGQKNRLPDRSFRASIASGKQRSTTSLSASYAIMPTASFTKRLVVNEGKFGLVDTTDARHNLPVFATDEMGSVMLPVVHELPIHPAQWPHPQGLASREVVQSETTAPVSVPTPARQKGLSVRFVVSPDLSVIGLRNFQRPGTNLGLMAEYRLASRWSIQAGALWSTKVYRALPSDYKPGRYAHVQPETVDGQCNMIDIPINIRYDIILRPGSAGRESTRWFISGGITSYVMLQEDYKSNFANPGDPRIYPWQRQPVSTNSGAYGFSQLNFSVGYERSLSRRLSWQVEPFVKAPLKGVGFYKVKLLSTGAFLSLRYKF